MYPEHFVMTKQIVERAVTAGLKFWHCSCD
jgi:hypothetical protein